MFSASFLFKKIVRVHCRFVEFSLVHCSFYYYFHWNPFKKIYGGPISFSLLCFNGVPDCSPVYCTNNLGHDSVMRVWVLQVGVQKMYFFFKHLKNRVSVCLSVCLSVCARVRMCAYAHVCMCAHMCVHVRACVHACMNARACACVHVCVRLCVLMHVRVNMCVSLTETAGQTWASEWRVNSFMHNQGWLLF